jgi:hypothetical protein
MEFQSHIVATSQSIEKIWGSHPFLAHLQISKCPTHRHLSNKDCLSFVVCLLLAPLIIGFFSFFFAAAIYSSNEANWEAVCTIKQSIFLRFLWSKLINNFGAEALT